MPALHKFKQPKAQKVTEKTKHTGVSVTSSRGGVLKRKAPGEAVSHADHPEKKRLKAIHDPEQSSEGSVPPIQTPSGNATTTEPCSEDSVNNVLITNLSTSHELKLLRIISSSSIAQRTRMIVSHLLPDGGTSHASKQRVVVVHAKSSVAGKLISSIEIAKREFSSRGQRWFQYSSLTSETERVKAKHHASTKQALPEALDNEPDDIDPTEGTAFQTLDEIKRHTASTAFDNEPKFRDVPVLTIFLSLASVRSLKETLGEQTG
ncbi:hypothetical protein LTR66_006038 [Elasticomyces elasticus]|nr:hypothetical protein LTR66_006038 [Elasticomyces elasticus]KAK5006163.1 hypothetical protein LTR28_006820 [Elasticomyces elasticus]